MAASGMELIRLKFNDDRSSFASPDHGRYRRPVIHNTGIVGRDSCTALFNRHGRKSCYYLKSCFGHGAESWFKVVGDSYGGFVLVMLNGTMSYMLTMETPSKTSNGEYGYADACRAADFPDVAGHGTLEDLDGWKFGVVSLFDGARHAPVRTVATANVQGAGTIRYAPAGFPCAKLSTISAHKC